MRRVYLIRHGLTEGNRLRRYIGRTDEPLCAAGRAALSTAPLKGIETVYVSPLLRARAYRRTATIGRGWATHMSGF